MAAPAGDSIGMMEGAYFVSRKEILDWLNETLAISLTKVEQTCTGAVACQLLDMIFPGKVPVRRINWGAKHYHEYVGNYKIVQDVFNKMNVEKHVEVAKLSRGLYMDNLEFMQWFKRFFELNFGGQEYDPTARRERGKGGPAYNTAVARAVRSGGDSGGRSSGSRRGRSSRGRGGRTGRATRGGRSRDADEGSARASKPARSSDRLTRGAGRRRPAASGASAAAVSELEKENAELKLTVDGLEKERDFYFGKLRDIEVLLQGYDGKDTELAELIFKILYATEDDFVALDEDGVPVDDGDDVAAGGHVDDVDDDDDDAVLGAAGAEDEEDDLLADEGVEEPFDDEDETF
eukprot:PLAT14378.1.p2 GENE.PLAT14378.1~~PLAT14378.1.p2  ORF type:complete len:367 (-),score=180.76 PLAT14378.1:336-1379(-)